ncbi:TPA: preprotein translocase, partial [Candidatus Saccharibacteria bacterium]|nr:preprotein translocase [Candidatus Saccharibacteria bacterium]
VLHSFTDNTSNLERGLSEGLYIGLNGISTFTKDENQQKIFDSIPENHMLFETDAPFLTPSPHRGKVNEPAFVRHVAEYHASRRGVELEHLARVTSANASTLFGV